MLACSYGATYSQIACVKTNRHFSPLLVTFPSTFTIGHKRTSTFPRFISCLLGQFVTPLSVIERCMCACQRHRSAMDLFIMASLLWYKLVSEKGFQKKDKLETKKRVFTQCMYSTVYYCCTLNYVHVSVNVGNLEISQVLFLSLCYIIITIVMWSVTFRSGRKWCKKPNKYCDRQGAISSYFFFSFFFISRPSLAPCNT